MPTQARTQWEQDLRHALAQEEFIVVYQPVVSLATGAPVAFEALVRWQHPERGLIMPDTFIPLLEETGLILQLDEWVLREACCQLSVWQRTSPGLGINVNLSRQHFRYPDLATRVGQIAAASGIAPDQLRLEITERVMLSRPNWRHTCSRNCARLGCRYRLTTLVWDTRP